MIKTWKLSYGDKPKTWHTSENSDYVPHFAPPPQAGAGEIRNEVQIPLCFMR